MIVYNATKQQFRDDVFSNNIENKINDLLYSKIHRRVNDNEVRAFKNSMQYMDRVLADDEIPEKSSIAIEYVIPQSSKRIDFIIAGQNADKKDSVIIIELKQWENVETTEKDAIVKTFVAKANREVEHPSYQAWTYSALMHDYNSALQDGTIELTPCAYLHNCEQADVIRDKRYDDHLQKAPAFLKNEALKLRNFIKKHVRFGDKNNVMYCIENGKIKPSKGLADALSSMLAGNPEFLMIDEQKVIYENIIHEVKKQNIGKKKVFIIEGGPGTGKSVVAVNLLVRITAMEKVAQYVTKNSAPREVYVSKLTGSMKKSHINNLFKGSGCYYDIKPDTFDVLIVDEAHRLNEKSGMFQNLGENQIKELINAAKISVFFLDNDQIVTFKDIGKKSEIEQWANKYGAEIFIFQLKSQFRCNGSTAYISWLDNVLGIRQTANFELNQDTYDFRVFDNPHQMREEIEKKNIGTNSARIVAGYCWDWESKRDPSVNDIKIDDHKFEMRWNLASDGMLWILKDNSVKEAGCIHTCQGLELDYIGVIIGDDLIARNGVIRVNPDKRARTDQSLKGYKQLLKKDPKLATSKMEAIIKNTYKTLMTRGLKGCFIFCTDKETGEYFKSFLTESNKESKDTISTTCPFEILDIEQVIPFKNAIPIVNFKAAAGRFSGFSNIEEFQWAILPEPYVAKKGFFICQVMGESMNKKIRNGSWCLFKKDPGGTREGKTVLVHHHKIQDADFGKSYTIKNYHSIKVQTEYGWKHSKIILRPNSYFTHYQDIVLEENEALSLEVIGELVAIID